MSKDKKASYYDAGGIETIEIVKAKLSPEGFRGYLLGTALVYLCRLNFKHSENTERVRDAEKAGIFLGWLTEEMETKPTTEEDLDSRPADCWNVSIGVDDKG